MTYVYGQDLFVYELELFIYDWDIFITEHDLFMYNWTYLYELVIEQLGKGNNINSSSIRSAPTSKKKSNNITSSA